MINCGSSEHLKQKIKLLLISSIQLFVDMHEHEHTHTHRHSSFDLNLYNVTEKHSLDDAHMRDLRANEAHLNLRLLLQIYYNAVNAHMWRMIELS